MPTSPRLQRIPNTRQSRNLRNAEGGVPYTTRAETSSVPVRLRRETESFAQAFTKACGSRAEPRRFQGQRPWWVPRAKPLVAVYGGEILHIK